MAFLSRGWQQPQRSHDRGRLQDSRRQAEESHLPPLIGNSCFLICGCFDVAQPLDPSLTRGSHSPAQPVKSCSTGPRPGPEARCWLSSATWRWTSVTPLKLEHTPRSPLVKSGSTSAVGHPADAVPDLRWDSVRGHRHLGANLLPPPPAPCHRGGALTPSESSDRDVKPDSWLTATR